MIIVIIEDDESQRKILADFLSTQDILKDFMSGRREILEADSTSKGWELVCSHLPHVVLIDIDMGTRESSRSNHGFFSILRQRKGRREISGLDFVKVLCQRMGRGAVLIFAMSKDAENRQPTLATGADYFLQKPVDLNGLLQQLVEILWKPWR